MGYKKAQYYTLHIQQGSSHNPVDSTTYYLGGLITSPSPAQGVGRMYIPRTATIVTAYLFSYNDADVTNEDITFELQKNATTDYSLFSANFGGGKSLAADATNLDIPVSRGDYIELKITTPAWVTNPTNMRTHLILLLRY
jgi:hypothetical protein